MEGWICLTGSFLEGQGISSLSLLGLLFQGSEGREPRDKDEMITAYLSLVLYGIRGWKSELDRFYYAGCALGL